MKYIILEKGKFYKVGSNTYLIGANVPAISNVYACRITKTGKVKEPEAIYYRQESKYFQLIKPFKLNVKYQQLIIQLFCSDYFRTKYQDFPNVDKYLDLNTPLTYEEKIVNMIKCYKRSDKTYITLLVKYAFPMITNQEFNKFYKLAESKIKILK